MCNCEIFQLVGWDAIWSCCRDAQRWHSFPQRGLEGATEQQQVKLSDEWMPSPTWKNTVTVYAKGNVIIRLSHKQRVVWTQHTSDFAINACAAICMFVENCS